MYSRTVIFLSIYFVNDIILNVNSVNENVDLKENQINVNNITEEEQVSVLPMLQPLDFPPNMNYKEMMRILNIRRPRKMFSNLPENNNSSPVLSLNSFFLSLPKVSKLFRTKFKDACKTNSSAIVTPRGLQNCYEECLEKNNDYVHFFNNGFQKVTSKVTASDKIKIKIQPTYSYKISECRKKKKNPNQYLCYCRPEYVILVNSHFQRGVDDLMKNDQLTTRGIFGFMINTIYDILAFILFVIFHPIDALKFIVKFFIFGIPRLIFRIIYRLNHPNATYNPYSNYHPESYPRFQSYYNNYFETRPYRY